MIFYLKIDIFVKIKTTILNLISELVDTLKLLIMFYMLRNERLEKTATLIDLNPLRSTPLNLIRSVYTNIRNVIKSQTN